MLEEGTKIKETESQEIKGNCSDGKGVKNKEHAASRGDDLMLDISNSSHTLLLPASPSRRIQVT